MVREADEDLSVSLLEATLDSTADGLLVVDLNGNIVRYNQRFLEIWDLPTEVMERGTDADALEFAMQRLEKPEAFLARVEELYDEPERTSYDVLRFRDGRTIERFSRPQVLGEEVVGRVWSFRDVTEQRRMQEALIASERRYRRLFEESRHALYITTREGDFVDVNKAMLQLFGYSREELLQGNASGLYADPEARDRFQAEIEAEGSVRNYEIDLVDRTGEVLSCVVTSTTRVGPDGELLGYEGIIEDVTQRKRSTEALRRSEEYFRALIENALDTIMILKADGTIRYESPSVHRVLGYEPSELVGLNIMDYVHPGDRDHARRTFLRGVAAAGTTATLEVRFRHRDGSWRTLEAVGRNMLDHPAVRGVVVNARDVTKRKEAEDRLLYDAFHDRLTGLPNRELFMDRLRQLVKRGRREGAPPYSVLVLNVDRFKVVNESLGHGEGDRLLVAIGRRLETSLRPGDTVARVGGDEFAILLDEIEAGEQAVAVADRIHASMAAPFVMGNREVYATVSIGVAGSRPEYHRAEEIVRDADIAMHRAKAEGQVRTEVFNTAMHDHAVAMMEMETDLRRAMERSEFILRYQPIVSLSDGRTVGFESLIRWQHPERGELPPGEFLELAEETGLIVPLGWWTLEEACHQIRRLQGTHESTPYVAVNLSATQLSQPDLVDGIRSIIERTEIRPHTLRLELTENVVMKYADSTIRTLERLNELGVHLMIDDFGMGYSSLSYLHRFAADALKIDGSFIRGMGPNGENSEIVRTIVALADELGMGVVAEGVETAEQFRMVRILGCQSAQGFHLAHPLEDVEVSGNVDRVWELA